MSSPGLPEKSSLDKVLLQFECVCVRHQAKDELWDYVVVTEIQLIVSIDATHIPNFFLGPRASSIALLSSNIRRNHTRKEMAILEIF